MPLEWLILAIAMAALVMGGEVLARVALRFLIDGPNA
jgi:hypothetical protein